MEISDGIVRRIRVERGAPCGATWEAARRVEGLPVDEALVRISLDVQYYCAADPAGWDPIHGHSPLHFAGDIHKAALRRAAREAGVDVEEEE